MSRCVMLLAMLVGCLGSHQGTAVGNPTMTASLAKTTHLSVTQAKVDLDHIALIPCDGSAEVDVPGDNVDLATPRAFPLPTGVWCRVDLVLDGPMELRATGDTGHVLSGKITPGGLRFTVAQATAVGTSPSYVVEIGGGGWLDAEALGLDAADVTLDEGSPHYAAIVTDVQTETALYVDTSGDGSLSDAERGAGPIATATPFATDAPDTADTDTNDVTDTSSSTDTAAQQASSDTADSDTSTDTGTPPDTSADTDTDLPS